MTRAKWGILTSAAILGTIAVDTWAYVVGGYEATLSATMAHANDKAPLTSALFLFATGILFSHWFWPAPKE